jgi:diguanylate cyclase (GGDEF)-like protein/PAS domain S-box-containing protein
MIKYRSIKKKILAPLLVSILVVFVIFQVINDVFQYNLYQDSKLTHIQTLGRTVSYNLEAPLLFEDYESAQEQVDTFKADPSVKSVLLYDAMDKTVAAYQPDKGIDWFESIKYNWELEGAVASSGRLFVYVPIEDDGELLGKLKIAAEVDFEKSKLQHLIEASSLIVLLGIGILYYLYGRLSRLILTPVYQIKEAMTALLGNSSNMEPIQIKQYDELGDLVDGFNTMIARIRARDRQISASIDKLENERNFANELIESIAHGLLVVDNKGMIKHDNRHAGEQFGIVGSMVGTNINKYFLYQDKNKILMALLGRAHLNDDHFTILGANGDSRVLRVTTLKTTHENMVLFSIFDVTEEIARNYKQQLATGIFENSQDGIIVLDNSGKILMVNPAFESLLGYSEESVVEEQIYEATRCQDFEQKNQLIRKAVLEHGYWEGELKENHADGSEIPLSVQASFIASDKGEPTIECDLVLICSDLRDQKEMERLEHIASHDPLTQLANRTKLMLHTQALLDQGKHGDFGMLFLDLDGFKSVNDQWGHDVGDRVLQETAKRLQAVVRDDDLVCRLAGDEFVILVQAASEMLCHSLAERILNEVSEPIMFGHDRVDIGVSIGVHMTDAESVETEASAVIKQADKAMYRAKFMGKGQFAASTAE